MPLRDRFVRDFDRVGINLLDVLLAVVVAAVVVASVVVQDVESGMREPNALSIAFALGASASLAFRRMAPIGAVLGGTICVTIPVLFGYPEGLTPFIFYVLVAGMAARCPLNRSLVGLAIAVTAVAILAVAAENFDLVVATATLVIVVLCWMLGSGIRFRLDAAQAGVKEAERQAETERLRAEQVVSDERLRIAQDLHDVVAHSMSVIAVQAGMGSHVLEQDPAKAHAALDAISEVSRSTLTEMRRLLGTLRSADGSRSYSPAPSMDDLPDLVDELRSAGLPVVLSVEGEPTASHPGVELSAYRVVQESLTNVMKHAGAPTHVRATIRYLPEGVSIEVSDDGRGLASASPPPGVAGVEDGGHGLLGMRERVSVWGGHISTGPRPGGGYVVRATLPYRDAP